jgi:RimJ/RimL family protein N-acetyltransferase
MLNGELTGLRARSADDAEILHEELYEDVDDWVRGSNLPWVPIASGPGSPYAAPDPADERRGPAPSAAEFSIVELASRELAGQVALWGIDEHNRMAHIGIELRPAFRGRGLGADAVRVVCRYGFALRGLHRLQLETLADNHAMIAVAEKLGFAREGVTRGSSWMNGRFMDDVIFGLLAEEFSG